MKLKHENSNPKLQFLSAISLWSWKPPFPSFRSSFVSGAKSLELNRFIRNCTSLNQELVVDGESGNGSMSEQGIELQGDANGSISSVEVEVEEVKKIDDLANQSIWGQMKEIVMFIGSAAGLWLCGPLMSLIDTTVIGQRSSLELAALVGRQCVSREDYDLIKRKGLAVVDRSWARLTDVSFAKD